MVNASSCSVHMCASNASSKNVHWFRLPNNQDEAEEWTRFINEANDGVKWKPHKNIVLCSKHFQKCCLCESPTGITVNLGHFPTVLNGKIIPNGKSRCMFHQQRPLKIYLNPYKRQSQTQHDFLVKKLSSFALTKIVVGDPSSMTLNPPSIPSPSNSDEAAAESSKSLQTSSSNNLTSTNTATGSESAHASLGTVANSGEKLRIMCRQKRTLSQSNRKEKPGYERGYLGKPSKMMRQQNQALRNSVTNLKERVATLESEIKSLKAAARNTFKWTLQQKNTGATEPIDSDPPNCGSCSKCGSKIIEVIDIS